jgi:hypothetical protein
VSLHLVKLCVGVDRVEQLTEWGRIERGRGVPPIVHTRQTPKRAAEILDGGSLYWVIKGVILCRQAIVRIDTIEEGANTRCEIELAPEVVLTAPQPRRAFQGWRYFEAKDAPPDLTTGEAEGLPPEVARELRALGAW